MQFLERNAPHVLILMATYNGAPWLEEQLHSISAQQGVKISLVVSDDQSSDATINILNNWSKRINIDVLPTAHYRFGNAHRNFLRLICDCNLDAVDYVAFADQDDIWLPHKLANGIQRLITSNSDGYSSSVTAFWPNGKLKYIKKAFPLKKYDYLFESAGPGCTFIIPIHKFLIIKEYISRNFESLQSLWVHDWLIYAYIRSTGGRWCIDDRSTMLYRQHERNQVGANYGLSSVFKRLLTVWNGNYRAYVLSIASAIGCENSIVELLRRFRFLDRLRLILHVREFRRKILDQILLIVLLFIMR